MFFRPDGPQEISINDIATTFAAQEPSETSVGLGR